MNSGGGVLPPRGFGASQSRNPFICCEKDDLIGARHAPCVHVDRGTLKRVHPHALPPPYTSVPWVQQEAGKLKASMDLYFAFYNFVREHRTIRCTPAQQAGILPSALSIGDLVDMAA